MQESSQNSPSTLMSYSHGCGGGCVLHPMLTSNTKLIGPRGDKHQGRGILRGVTFLAKSVNATFILFWVTDSLHLEVGKDNPFLYQ